MSDVDLDIALTRFDLRRWCLKHRFKPQGRKKEEHLHDCPMCGGEDKLSINVVNKHYRCFTCSVGTLLDVVAAFEGSFRQAIQVVLENQTDRKSTIAHINDTLGEDDTAKAKTRDPSWSPAIREPPPFFTPLTGHVPYTARRRLCIENLIALGAGYCTGGRYQDRLVFPVRRYPDGAWIYFQSRAMWERSEERDPKFYLKNLNPTSDTDALADASDVMLGLEFVEAYRIKRVAIVEGPTDWTQMGPGTVALFGKVVSDRHVMLLVRAGVTEIDVCLDPDAWEHPKKKERDGSFTVQLHKPKPAVTACEKLSLAFKVNVAMWPKNYDPGDYSPSDNALWRAAASPWGNGSKLASIR